MTGPEPEWELELDCESQVYGNSDEELTRMVDDADGDMDRWAARWMQEIENQRKQLKGEKK